MRCRAKPSVVGKAIARGRPLLPTSCWHRSPCALATSRSVPVPNAAVSTTASSGRQPSPPAALSPLPPMAPHQRIDGWREKYDEAGASARPPREFVKVSRAPMVWAGAAQRGQRGTAQRQRVVLMSDLEHISGRLRAGDCMMNDERRKVGRRD